MWYVIQTTTGKEQELVDLLHKMLPKTVYNECFFMKRQLLKRLGGEWLEVTETLFPAYVFLDLTKPEEVFYELKRVPEFSKILGDNLGDFIPLEEEEKEFLERLCEVKNQNAESRERTEKINKTELSNAAKAKEDAYLVRSTSVYLDQNGAIEHLNGPLEHFKNKIVRLNLRKRYAVIEITMRGEKQTAMLGIKLEKD